MPSYPLYIAIIWHMHQPFYRDLRTGGISLPWVRLHAAKDYLRMAEALAKYPGVHATVNLVPSLVDQMLAWARGRESDRLAQLGEQEHWNHEEKQIILNLTFSVNWDKVIRRHPRYAELLDRRPQALADPETFTEADYRDLLGWFNLVWIAPQWLERDSALTRLVARGRDFTVQEMRTMHRKQREIATAVLPLYRQLAARGQLEIVTCPYFHPILPLLFDVGSARRPSPGLPLPHLHFAAPEDAAAQLQMAVQSHRTHFGTSPQGLWPSEGAVSPEILPMVIAAGFKWLASDEVMLERSLGRSLSRDDHGMITDPRALYRPYRLLANGDIGPYIIFRDHELSDRVGFLYQHLPGEQAAEDMIYRFLEIRRRLDDPGTPYLVSVILDGENAWEHYERNGEAFLNALYRGLSQQPDLRAVTVSEYLAEHRPAGILARLATGSWISGDLTTWIGDPEHNRAWEALARTRAFLAHFESTHPSHPGLGGAWQAIYAAEGSDWFWWYSRRNHSDQDALYDQLFRDDLASVYEKLGETVPAWLNEPIYWTPAAADGRPAAGYCSPALNAAPYPGDDWALAAVVQPASVSSGTMQRADGYIGRLFLGHDEHNLYLRLDLRDRLDEHEVAIYLGGATGGPVNQRVRAHYPEPAQPPSAVALTWEIRRVPGQPAPFLYRAAGHDQWELASPVGASALGERVMEVCVPLQTLGLQMGGELSVLATVARGGSLVAQLPERGMSTFVLQRFERA
jgi:alpha-amylase/alpha-mannosidase (GH57 family)